MDHGQEMPESFEAPTLAKNANIAKAFQRPSEKGSGAPVHGTMRIILTF
jgi:hypothetical protein